MSDELEALRSALADVTGRLTRLEQRLAELEGRALDASGRAEDPREGAPAAGAGSLPRAPLALVGRTSLVLAGAYLVRAATDGQAWPAALGIGLGLTYAAFWQLRADREAQAGRCESAAFHALASSLIAFPLIWEATTRFALLSTAAAYALLVAFGSLGLAVAWRRRLPANAALTTGLALATAFALLHARRELAVAFPALLALATILEGLAGSARRALPSGLRWAAGLALDLVALLLIFVTLHPALLERYAGLSPASAAALLLALPLLYLASTALRTLGCGRPLTLFDVVQGAAALLLGCGGAWRVLTAHGLSPARPIGVTLLLAAASYAGAFLVLERRDGHGRSFYFYSSAGFALALAGTSALGLGPAVSLVWGALGLAAVAVGRLGDRMTLRVHGSLFLTAAAIASGLVDGSLRGLGGCSTAALSGPAWLAASLAGLAWLLLAGDPRAVRAGAGRTPQLVLALLAVLGFGRAIQLGIWGLLAGPLAEDAGAAAVVRTALLAALALGLAGLARRAVELGWLVYPLIALGGLRVLTQDLRVGRPATLVVSFALYGLVLMLAPRLLRSRTGDSSRAGTMTPPPL